MPGVGCPGPSVKGEAQVNPRFINPRRDGESQDEAPDFMLPRKSSSQLPRDRTAVQHR